METEIDMTASQIVGGETWYTWLIDILEVLHFFNLRKFCPLQFFKQYGNVIQQLVSCLVLARLDVSPFISQPTSLQMVQGKFCHRFRDRRDACSDI